MKLSRVPYAKGREESEEVAGAVRPVYVLPGAYAMPADQQRKRQREAGAPKWTAVREAKALKDISDGKEPEPIDSRLVAPREEPMEE